MTSLTEALHEEVHSSGVHVTALCPGLTKTEFQQRSNTQSYSSSYPDFVWTSAESVAATGLADVAKNRAIAVPGALYKGDGRCGVDHAAVHHPPLLGHGRPRLIRRPPAPRPATA